MGPSASAVAENSVGVMSSVGAAVSSQILRSGAARTGAAEIAVNATIVAKPP